MLRYMYKGPVYHFTKCINPCWQGITEAQSTSKAFNNLTFRAKKEHGLVANARISLDRTKLREL